MHTIIAATEFSGRCTLALERARVLAREAGAELVLVHAAADERLKSEFEAMAIAVDAKAHFQKGEPFRVILEAAAATDARFIVLGAPGKRGMRETIRGTTAEQVIRHSEVPVLMAAGVQTGPYRRIVFATDFSEASLQAVDGLNQIAPAEDVRLTILNVFDAPAIPLMTRAGTTIPEVETYITEQGRLSARQLKAFADRAGLKGANLVSKLARETTGRAICAAAEAEKAELIVVGTRGRSGMIRFMLGSVAEEVLRLSGTDVLAIPVRS